MFGVVERNLFAQYFLQQHGLARATPAKQGMEEEWDLCYIYKTRIGQTSGPPSLLNRFVATIELWHVKHAEHQLQTGNSTANMPTLDSCFQAPVPSVCKTPAGARDLN